MMAQADIAAQEPLSKNGIDPLDTILADPANAGPEPSDNTSMQSPATTSWWAQGMCGEYSMPFCR